MRFCVIYFHVLDSQFALPFRFNDLIILFACLCVMFHLKVTFSRSTSASSVCRSRGKKNSATRVSAELAFEVSLQNLEFQEISEITNRLIQLKIPGNHFKVSYKLFSDLNVFKI